MSFREGDLTSAYQAKQAAVETLMSPLDIGPIEKRDAEAGVDVRGNLYRERRELLAEVRRLRNVELTLRLTLLEAANDVEDYIQYAGDYLAAKWKVSDDVARYRAVAKQP